MSIGQSRLGYRHTEHLPATSANLTANNRNLQRNQNPTLIAQIRGRHGWNLRIGSCTLAWPALGTLLWCLR